MSTLIRWNPVRRRNAINHFFEESWRNLPTAYQNVENRHALALDVREDDEAYSIIAALPGVKAEDVNVRLHDGLLTIEAEIEEHNVEEGERQLIKERHYGSFSRSLRLPDTVNEDEIEAGYENGVLTLVVPKAEEAQPKLIPVTVSKN